MLRTLRTLRTRADQDGLQISHLPSGLTPPGSIGQPDVPRQDEVARAAALFGCGLGQPRLSVRCCWLPAGLAFTPFDCSRCDTLRASFFCPMCLGPAGTPFGAHLFDICAWRDRSQAFMSRGGRPVRCCSSFPFLRLSALVLRANLWGGDTNPGCRQFIRLRYPSTRGTHDKTSAGAVPAAPARSAGSTSRSLSHRAQSIYAQGTGIKPPRKPAIGGGKCWTSIAAVQRTQGSCKLFRRPSA